MSKHYAISSRKLKTLYDNYKNSFIESNKNGNKVCYEQLLI